MLYASFVVHIILGLSISKIPYFLQASRGRSGGAMVPGKLPVPGSPIHLDHSQARAYCTYCRCEWSLPGHFFL